jgi:hypothetical protein
MGCGMQAGRQAGGRSRQAHLGRDGLLHQIHQGAQATMMILELLREFVVASQRPQGVKVLPEQSVRHPLEHRVDLLDSLVGLIDPVIHVPQLLVNPLLNPFMHKLGDPSATKQLMSILRQCQQQCQQQWAPSEYIQ